MIPCMIEGLHAAYVSIADYGDGEEPLEERRMVPVQAFNHQGEPMVWDIAVGRLLRARDMPGERFCGVYVIRPDDAYALRGDGVVE